MKKIILCVLLFATFGLTRLPQREDKTETRKEV